MVLPDGTLFGEGVKTRLKEHLLEECNLHTIVRLPNSVFKPYASIGTNLLFFEKGEPTKDIWFYEHRVPEGQKAYSMTKPIRFEHLQGCIDWWGGAKREDRQETPQAWRVGVEELRARGYNLDIKNPHTVASDLGDPERLLLSLTAAESEATSLRETLKALLLEALREVARRDSLITISELLTRATRSRACGASFLIWRFAVSLFNRIRGMNQRTELLRRIATEKATLVKAGGLRQEKAPKQTDSQFLPFAMKAGWQAATIQQLVLELQTGPFGSSLHQSDYQVGGIPVINPASIQNYRIVPIAKMAVGPATLERLASFKLRAGDIVLGRRGEMGRSAVVSQREAGWLCGTGSLILRMPQHGLYAEYLMLVIGSPYVRAYLGGAAVGATMQNLNQGILLSLIVPVPPLSAQHRIVRKVGEVMALIDRIESQAVDVETARARLLAAVLHEAVRATEDGEDAAFVEGKAVVR